MKVIYVNTFDLYSNHIDSYVGSFNRTFNKNKSEQYFKKKYLNSKLGYSFHSLIVNNKNVCGALSVIPYQYQIDSNKHLLGLVVDAFIEKDYRKKSPFLLLKMYNLIKKEIKKLNIIACISVPNLKAYSYWVKVVRWKKLKTLEYNIMILNPFLINNFGLDFIRSIFFYFFYLISRIGNMFFFQKLVFPKIRLIKHANFNLNRFIDNQNNYKTKDFECYYSIRKEKGVKIAFLIDFYNSSGVKDFYSLMCSIKIIRRSNPDLIAYVGNLGFKQIALLKIPSFLPIRKLNLIIDILDVRYKNTFSKTDDFDFGLLNFDVS